MGETQLTWCHMLRQDYETIFISVKNAHLVLGDQATRRQYDKVNPNVKRFRLDILDHGFKLNMCSKPFIICGFVPCPKQLVLFGNGNFGGLFIDILFKTSSQRGMEDNHQIQRHPLQDRDYDRAKELVSGVKASRVFFLPKKPIKNGEKSCERYFWI